MSQVSGAPSVSSATLTATLCSGSPPWSASLFSRVPRCARSGDAVRAFWRAEMQDSASRGDRLNLHELARPTERGYPDEHARGGSDRSGCVARSRSFAIAIQIRLLAFRRVSLLPQAVRGAVSSLTIVFSREAQVRRDAEGRGRVAKEGVGGCLGRMVT